MDLDSERDKLALVTSEGKETSSWISKDVATAMLFEQDFEGPLGIITQSSWIE